MRMRFAFRFAPLALAAAFLFAPGDARAQSDADGIVVYNAQHASLTEEWVKGFTKDTGIKVTIRKGSDMDTANQIVQEGAASPADVFLTENSPAMALVDSRRPVRAGRQGHARPGSGRISPQQRQLGRYRGAHHGVCL